jgi:hypothetical protein
VQNQTALPKKSRLALLSLLSTRPESHLVIV